MRLTALAAGIAISAIALTTGTQAAYAAPKQDTNKTETGNYIVIQPGDTLSKIASEHGSTVERIFSANISIENPNLIFPYEKLRIPLADEQLAPRATPQPATPASAVVPPQEAPVAEAEPAEPAAPAAPAAPVVASGSVWDSIAMCEATGDWSINTGNGFSGGLQFTPSTWSEFGGGEYAPMAHQASREQQIDIAEKVLSVQGWGAWPACTSKLGLR